MNLQDITFGVEIECTVPAGTLAVGGYGYANGIDLAGHGFPAGWRGTYDTSIRVQAPGHVGVEVVSGKLQGDAGIESLVAAVRRLVAIGAKVNASCGMHVHVGMPVAAMAKLENVVYQMGNLEPAFYAASGTRTRERSNWCRSIKTPGGHGAPAHKDLPLKAAPTTWNVGHDWRYRSLNLYNLATGAKPTVEFRVFGSTLNVCKAVAYVRMAVGLVHKATNTARRVDWDAKQKSRVNPGAAPTGAEQMKRFFYRLGWNRGHNYRPGTGAGEFAGAECGAYGMVGMGVAGAPGVEAMKAELMRLARKYDADGAPR